MRKPPLKSLTHYMKSVTERRQEAKIQHKLEEILFIAVVATIANAAGWEEIVDFAKGRETWLKQFIELKNGTPSHDTFERAFRWIEGKEFERCFILWMREVCQTVTGLRLIAIDGKTMRGSGDASTGRHPLRIVSAQTDANNMVLGQVKTEEKSNEITAIPVLIDLIDIRDAVVSIDAMGTQREIAAKILSKKADYVLSVKGNQPTLHDDIRLYLEDGIATDFRDMAHE